MTSQFDQRAGDAATADRDNWCSSWLMVCFSGRARLGDPLFRSVDNSRRQSEALAFGLLEQRGLRYDGSRQRRDKGATVPTLTSIDAKARVSHLFNRVEVGEDVVLYISPPD